MDLRSVGLTSAALLCAAAAHAQTPSPGVESRDALARGIFQELIEINTTDSVGNITTAAQTMGKRLLDAGYPAADLVVLGPNERKKNLVVRLRGTGKRKPILLIGHLDVVEARREDWTTDPFKFLD